MTQHAAAATVSGYGAFAWQFRMGIHEAYHLSASNRMLHWFTIPVQLFAVVALLNLIPVHGTVNLALVAFVAIAPVYLITEWFLGALMLVTLYGIWAAADVLLPAFSWSVVLGLVLLFAVFFSIQVRFGHGVLEDGRDDTELNLKEFARTKNPIPLLLVFYYHLVEIALHWGYRPQLRARIEAVKAMELTEMKIN